jgi:hypothetical protein
MFAPAQPWTAHRVRALIDESRPWPRYELIDGELLVTPAPVLEIDLAAFFKRVWRN